MYSTDTEIIHLVKDGFKSIMISTGERILNEKNEFHQF